MKKNKLIYMFIFAFVFLGFMNNVNASCCYKRSDGIYTYDATMSGSVCMNKSGDPNANESTCKAKNPDVCCDKTTGTVKNGLTDTECASKGYKKVAYGTCFKTVTSTQEVYGESKEDCETKLHGQYDTNTGKCTYTTTTDIDVSENNAANIQNPNNPSNNPSSDPTPQERNGDGSALWDNTKPAPSMEGVEININCEGIKDVLGLVKTIYNLIRYATPVVLIILGSVDFFKAVMAGKEDDIKKNQKRFVSRLILAVIVFLLLSVFELIASILSKSGVGDGDSWLSCWNSLAKILSI